MANALLNVPDISEYLGRQFTATEAVRVALDLDGLVASIEGHLNRSLSPVTIDDERHVAHGNTTIYPFVNPVRRVNGVRVGSLTNPSTTAYNETVFDTIWNDGTILYVSYEAGDDVDDSKNSLVKSIVTQALVGGVLQGVQIAVGAVSGYSVEGTSIRYHNKADDKDSLGPVVVADLNALAPWRIPVVA